KGDLAEAKLYAPCATSLSFDHRQIAEAPMRTIDRRHFLRASAAVSLLPSLPADLMAQASTAAAPASRWDAGSVRHLLPTISDSRRQRHADQSILQHAAERGADAERRRNLGARPHGRYARRALALLRDRSAAGPAPFTVAGRRARRGAMRALGARDLPGAGRAAGKIPAPDL